MTQLVRGSWKFSPQTVGFMLSAKAPCSFSKLGHSPPQHHPWPASHTHTTHTGRESTLTHNSTQNTTHTPHTHTHKTLSKKTIAHTHGPPEPQAHTHRRYTHPHVYLELLHPTFYPFESFPFLKVQSVYLLQEALAIPLADSTCSLQL